VTRLRQKANNRYSVASLLTNPSSSAASKHGELSDKAARAVLFAFDAGFSLSQKVLRYFLGTLSVFTSLSSSKDRKIAMNPKRFIAFFC